MSDNKKIFLKKVPIKSLIQMLTKIYDEGADFIDIEGKPTVGEQDSIKINVRPEYYIPEEDPDNTDPEYMVTEQDFDEKIDLEFPPIDDDDINDLIK